MDAFWRSEFEVKFLCPKCHAGYQVADERLSSGMRLRCKRCDNVFQLEDAKPLSVAGQRQSNLAPARAVGDSSLAFASSSSRGSAPAPRQSLQSAPRLSSGAALGVSADFDPPPPSWRTPEAPTSLSPGRLSAPKVPTFGGTEGASNAEAPLYPDSLAPGASVWPDTLKLSESRRVPLTIALASSALSLLIGLLIGFFVPDTLGGEPLLVGTASLPIAFGGVPTSGEESSSGSPSATAASPAPAAPSASEATAKQAPSKVASAGAAHPAAKPVRTLDSSKLERVPPKAEPEKVKAATAPESNETALGDRLSGAEIQRTVYRYQPSVRHSCWQRQLSNRDPSAPSTARVAVTLTIAPSGQVSQVSTSGDAQGYPGLASCIATKVKSWSFPKAVSSTTAKIPFTFAVQ